VKKLIRSSTASVSRLVNEKVHVTVAVDTSPLRRRFDDVTKPSSFSGSMRRHAEGRNRPDCNARADHRRARRGTAGARAVVLEARNQDLSIPLVHYVRPMEIKPSKGVKVVVKAQREAVFGEESVSIQKVSFNGGPSIGEMTGFTLAGFCEVEMPKVDGKKHWYPIGDLVGEHGEAVVEEEVAVEEEDAGDPETE